MKTKTIIILVLLIIFAIIVLQNAQAVDVRFLFWKLSISTIILLLITLFIGVLIGFLLGKIDLKRKKGTDNAELH